MSDTWWLVKVTCYFIAPYQLFVVDGVVDDDDDDDDDDDVYNKMN